MPSDRDFDRELRDLGPRVDYPPVPDLAGSVRGRLETEAGGPGSASRPRLQLRWIAAAALVLLVAVPVFSLAMRDTGGGAFSAAGEGEKVPGGETQESIIDGGDAAGQTGRPNGPVPDVVGMELTAACEKLSSREYVGYVIRAVEDTGTKPRRVIEQKPLAGSKGYVGGPVDLTVSEPYSEDVLQGLPRGPNPACLDATR